MLQAGQDRRAAVLLVPAVLLVAAMQSVALARPNVVLFYADDFGWTDWEHHPTLNPTGSPLFETPNLTRLAESGVNFTNAYASSAVCSPSRVSIMTGKTPARTGVTDFLGGGRNQSSRLRSPVWNQGILGADITIAESLGSAAGGYDTAFIGKWHAGGNPLSHGFDTNVAGGGAGCPCDGEGGFFAGPDGRWNMPGLNTPGTYAPDTYLTHVLGDFAEDFLATRASDPDPFFLMMAPYQVHVPLQAPAATVSKYSTKIANLQQQGIDLRGHDEPTYAAMVEEMDVALGRVMTGLDDPNGDGLTDDSIRDETMIIFASDNGGLTVSELGYPIPTRNDPLRDGKGSFYEAGIRTPLIVSWNGNAAVSQGVVSDARVTTHDLYPMLLDAANLTGNAAVPRNDSIDGVSFLSALEGGIHDRGIQFWHYPHESNQHSVSGGTVTGGSFVSALRDDELKLLWFYEERRYELYDLATDPGEANNLLATVDPSAAEVFRLSAELHQYLDEVNAAMPIARSTGLAEALPDILWPTVQGDFDLDGLLDADDWAVLRDGFGGIYAGGGVTAGYSFGDFNLDGRVDRFDFDGFAIAYEAANGSGSFAKLLATVPEPSSGAILLLGGAALITACRKRRVAR